MTRQRRAPCEFGMTVAFHAQRVVVGVRGEVDLLTAPELRSVLNALADRGHSRLVLDFAELDFLDAAGLRVLASISARLRPSGSLTVRSLPAVTRRVLHLTGVSEVVHIEPPDIAEADARLDVPAQSGQALTEQAELTALIRAAGSRATDLVDAALGLVVALVRATVGGADGVGVTLRRHGRFATVASSDETVELIDSRQYATGEGPCVAAATEGLPFHVESSAEETRWPAFIPAAVAAGFASVLSAPLLTAARPVGSINIYSRTPWAFGSEERSVATLIASKASAILTTSGVGITDDVGNLLHDALRSREVIAQGQGVLMERHGLSTDAAYASLRSTARQAEHPVRRQAADVVASTTRRVLSDDTIAHHA